MHPKPNKKQNKLLPVVFLLLCANLTTGLLVIELVPVIQSEQIFLPLLAALAITILGTLAFHFYSRLTHTDQQHTLAKIETITSYIFDVVAIINKDGVIIFKSQNSESLFGWKAEELIGQHALKNVHPKDHTALLETFTKISNEPHGRVDTECQYKCKDGTYKPIQIKAINLLHDPSIRGILFSYHDISKRKAAELKLINKEYKYRTLFENIIDVICVLDTEGNILETNNMATTVYEYSREELIGMNISQLVHPDDKQISGKFFEKLTNEGFYEHYEGRIITKSGKTKWIQVSSKALYNKGQYIGAQDIIRDITQRKELELTLKKSTQKLKTLNDTKDKFFSIIAHDLKTPFNSLLGLSAQLADKIDQFPPEKLKRILQQMHDSTNSAYELLINLLEWANSQRGKLLFSPEPIQLNSLIADQLDLFKETANNKNITINAELPHNYLITADKNMLMSILRNLISNALKFTHDGGEVRIKVESHPINTVICVQDNGIGMNNSDRRKLFKISESVSTPGTNNESGTGLGLILCEEFVSKHSGKIWVESKPGEGSCFRFSIPHQINN